MYANALPFRLLVTRLRLKYSPALNFTLAIYPHINSRGLWHLHSDVSIGELADVAFEARRSPHVGSRLSGPQDSPYLSLFAQLAGDRVAFMPLEQSET